MVKRASLHVQLVNCIAFAKCQPQVSLFIKVESARTIQRCAGNLRTVRSGGSLARASEGRNDAAFQVDATDSVIANVTNIEIAFAIKLNAVRFMKRGRNRRTFVARETCFAVAGHGANQSRSSIDEAHHVVHSLDNIEIALSV